MIKYNFLKKEKNLDSLFLLTVNNEDFFMKYKSGIKSFNKLFKFMRSADQYKYNEEFSSFLLEGVNQASSIDTKDYFIIVWKHTSEQFPVNLEQAIDQIKNNELDAFMIFDKLEKKFYWMNHFFSKINLYYSKNEDGLIFTNDTGLLADEAELTDPAKEIFEVLGWLPPEMEAYKDVHSSRPQNLYSYSLNDKLVQCEEQFNLASIFSSNFNDAPSTHSFYKLFKDSIRTKVDGNCFVLTGGCDTRLIMSTIDDNKDLLFWADNTLDRKDIYFDSCIFKNILKDHNLKGFLLDNKKKGRESFEPINIFRSFWSVISIPCRRPGL